jgi:hypothetical protein
MGLEPLLILAYGNRERGIAKPLGDDDIRAYAKYAEVVTDHFAGRVKLFEIWNEWNTTTGRTPAGSVESYIDLIRYVCPSIKSRHEKMTLLSGSPSGKGMRDGWLTRFIALDGYRICDGLAIHPYNWYEKKASGAFESMSMVDTVIEQIGSRDPSFSPSIYITEIGWPTYSGERGISAKTLSNYLIDFITLAKARPAIRGIWWYCLRDTGSDVRDPENNFGLLRQDLSRKLSGRVVVPGAPSISAQSRARPHVEQ